MWCDYLFEWMCEYVCSKKDNIYNYKYFGCDLDKFDGFISKYQIFRDSVSNV